MGRYRIVLNLSLLFLLTALTGCNGGASQEAWETVQLGLDKVNKHIGPVTDSLSSLSTEQLSEIMKYEYRVVRFPASASATYMETELNNLGKERWDCFNASPTPDGTIIYCKRIPYAMLRYFLRAM